MRFEWDQNDRYISNHGTGPMIARILCATDKTVTMERWLRAHPEGRRTRFELPIKFLRSPSCGWTVTNGVRTLEEK